MPGDPSRIGAREISGLVALGGLLVLVVALAIGVADGPSYTAHMRSVMLILVLLAVMIATSAVWLWLSMAAQHARLIAICGAADLAAAERRELLAASQAMAAAAQSLAAVLRDERATVEALTALAAHRGIDSIVVGGAH